MIPTTEEARAWLREQLLTWGAANFAAFPWRTPASLWHALAAEVMLQRTRAEQVVPAYNAFVQRYPTPAHLAADPDSAVFATLGLHWREPLLRDLARALADRPVPQTLPELLALPGVGDYIAAAFCSLHLGQPATIIDANVVRLYGRFFGFATDGETRRKRPFIALAQQMTPPENARAYNYALLDFTRELCTVTPDCPRCPLRPRCAYAAAAGVGMG
ncbi:MAG: hypothetical protein MUE40_16115 [Anaerolineae bacterium]|nr:hypothetical protein [Anaerolineae bacterium]